MQDRLFQSEEFGTPARSSATLFFICPYDTVIRQVRFAIRRLLWMGFHVVAYETTTAVFTAADPAILSELISQVREDIKARIARLKAEGGTEFGFFGSSLGSFILYNCVGSKVPEFRWGVFNTGGNIAAGIWNMASLRELHEARGWSLAQLEEAWAALQWPDFGDLDGCRFVFSSSRGDDIAPLANISHYLDPMVRAGAEVSLYEVPARSHRSTVIAGLVLAPRLVRKVRRPRRRQWRPKRLSPGEGPVVGGRVPGREHALGERADRDPERDGGLLREVRERRGDLFRADHPRLGAAARGEQERVRVLAGQAVGERWSLLVLRELGFGIHRFKDIQVNTGAPRETLALRLRTLEEAGVIERRRYCDRPPRDEYLLTAAGRELLPVLGALREWGERHVTGARP